MMSSKPSPILDNEFVSYNFTTSPKLPPSKARIKEYWIAGNGVFLRAARTGIDVCMQLSELKISGLPAIEPYFSFKLPLVPQKVLSAILELSQAAGPEEILFYLTFADNWELTVPEQIATASSVTPTSPCISYETALVEVHSHHQMSAKFSSIDDREETGKFRLFAVLGTVFTQPTISVRLGIYDCFTPIAANQIFELPPNLIDANRFIL